MTMKFKLQLSIFLLSSLLLTASISYFIYHYQVPEHQYTRQDKVNSLYINKSFWCESDGIILGSSRTFPLGHIEVAGMKLYNLAAHGMYPREYSAYIQYYKDTCKKDPANILIGLDFFTSNIHAGNWAEKPSFFIDRHNRPFEYLLTQKHIRPRWEAYIRSLGTWDYPTDFRPLREQLDKPLLRDDSLSLEEVPVIYRHNLYINRLYGRYDYNTGLKENFDAIVNENQASKIHVWITPVSNWMFSSLLKFSLDAEYTRFISDIIDSFGSAHNLMLMNPITAVQDNFLDISHIRVDILELMIKDTLNSCQCDVLGDYSQELNADILGSFFNNFHLYAQKHMPHGKQATVSEYLNPSFEVEIEQGSYLDLFLSDRPIHNPKKTASNISLCIEGKGDFSLIKIDATGGASSKIYQQRESCQFVINKMEGIQKIRIVPLFDYPLKLSAANVKHKLDN